MSILDFASPLAEAIGIPSAENRSSVRDRKKTNAEMIRGFTDEELADWLAGLCYRIFEMNPWLELPAGKQTWLGWLKQDAVL